MTLSVHKSVDGTLDIIIIRLNFISPRFRVFFSNSLNGSVPTAPVLSLYSLGSLIETTKKTIRCNGDVTMVVKYKITLN